MDSPSPPQAPDPYVTANAQAGANRDAAITTAELNRVNQYTPYGNLIWDRGAPTRTFNQSRYDEAVKQAQLTGGFAGGGMGGHVGNGLSDNVHWVGPEQAGGGGGSIAMPDRNADQFYDQTPSTQWSSRIELDPRVQSILDSQLATSQGLAGATNAALGRVNTTMGQAAPTPDANYRKQVEDALYSRQASRMDPQYQQQEQSLRSDLMNRGIVEGSEAWRTQMDNFGRGKNDAYDLARMNSITGGGREMASQYEMEMAGRNAVLNELNALRSGQQVMNPSFSNTQSGASVGAAPIAQAMQNQYQGQLGAYNADVAGNNQTMGAGLGAMATIAAAFV